MKKCHLITYALDGAAQDNFSIIGVEGNVIKFLSGLTANVKKGGDDS